MDRIAFVLIDALRLLATRLPAPGVESRPRLDVAAREDSLVLRVLCPCGTGVIGKDAQACADRKPGGNCVVDTFRAAEDAMFLVGAVEDVACDRLAVVRAD